MEEYYYNKLNKLEKIVYQEIKIGIKELKDIILVPKIELKKLSEIFFLMRLDHPEIFWASGFKCQSYADSDNYQIIPEYLFKKSKLKEQQKAIKARVDKIVRLAANYNELEKEKYVHDFLCKNVKYDKLKKAYSHEIIGPLGHGTGVCEGIAKSVKVLCDELGIWCIIVISESNIEKGIKYRHAWNVVKIGGKFYHLDVTFDNTLTKNEIRYDYFNLCDSHIFKDHEPLIIKVNDCADNSNWYYLKNKLSFTKVENLEKRIKQYAKKGKTLVFNWRGGYLTKEVFEEIIKITYESAKEKEKYAKIGLNRAQAIIQIDFVSEEKNEIVIEENAYENEI